MEDLAEKDNTVQWRQSRCIGQMMSMMEVFISMDVWHERNSSTVRDWMKIDCRKMTVVMVMMMFNIYVC